MLSAFSTGDDYFRDRLAPYLAEMVVCFKSGTVKTLDEAEVHAEPLKALPPVQRVLCSASILHSAGKSLRDSGATGAYYYDLVLIAGMKGCVAGLQDVMDRADRSQATSLVASLEVLAGLTTGLSRAQTIYMRGHLEHSVLDGTDGAFANALRKALATLEQEREPALASAQTQLRNGWTAMLARLESS